MLFSDKDCAANATRFSGSAAIVIADSGIAVHSVGSEPVGNSGVKPTVAISRVALDAKIIATVNGSIASAVRNGA
jgi:hypothetical protein